MQKFCKIILNTDWDILYKQRIELEEMIRNNLDSNMWGIVKLINELLDAAEEFGFWIYPTKH
jgi:hypothetical protein